MCCRFLNWLLQGCTLSSPRIVPQRFSHDLEKRFCEVFVICFIRQWMKRSKHGLVVFPPKKTLIWRRHCLIGQSRCSMTSKRSIDFLSVRFTNQTPCVCIRSITNQIALFPFVYCFCFVRALSFQSHKENRPSSKWPISIRPSPLIHLVCAPKFHNRIKRNWRQCSSNIFSGGKQSVVWEIWKWRKERGKKF